jgi:hypothetical protein
MEEIDVDEITELEFTGPKSETVRVTFKDGSTKTYNAAEHPEVLATLNHWTPPTA